MKKEIGPMLLVFLGAYLLLRKPSSGPIISQTELENRKVLDDPSTQRVYDLAPAGTDYEFAAKKATTAAQLFADLGAPRRNPDPVTYIRPNVQEESNQYVRPGLTNDELARNIESTKRRLASNTISGPTRKILEANLARYEGWV